MSSYPKFETVKGQSTIHSRLLRSIGVLTVLCIGWASPNGHTQTHRLIAARWVTTHTEPLDESVSVTPEYERHLKKILITIPVGYGFPGLATRNLRLPVRIQMIESAYESLLDALPDYTEVHIALRTADEGPLKPWLKRVESQHQVHLHRLNDVTAETDLWAQDVGEALTVGRSTHFLVSMDVDPAMERNQHIAASRQQIARAVFGVSSVIKAPFVFEGGNLEFDRVGDRYRILIGFNDLLLSIDNYNAIKKRFSRARLLEAIAEQFGVDDVIVMGREEQSPYLFHIDQAFILLADRVAVVNRIVAAKSSREERQLQYYNSQLKALGYRIITIDNTQTEIERRHTSTNAIPYVDHEPGRKRSFTRSTREKSLQGRRNSERKRSARQRTESIRSLRGGRLRARARSGFRTCRWRRYALLMQRHRVTSDYFSKTGLPQKLFGKRLRIRTSHDRQCSPAYGQTHEVILLAP